MGRELARSLGFGYLDTGIMYRAITWLALNNGIPVDDETSLGELARANPLGLVGDDSDQVLVAGHTLGPELRDSAVDSNVSMVSKAPPVRIELVAQQRQTAAKGNIVMIGRDIGTVVLPDADLKVYLDATIEERARRRYADFLAAGNEVSQEIVLEDIRRRDRIDSEREVSPLRPADDAVIIDTEGLSLDDVMDRVIGLVRGGK